MKRNNSHIRRRFSLLNLTAVILCMSVLMLIQFEFMDDIFLFSAKKDMIAAAKEISALDLKRDDFKSRISDIEANHSIYVELYSPRDLLIYTTDSNKTVYEEDHTREGGDYVLRPRVMKLISQETLSDGSYFLIANTDTNDRSKLVLYTGDQDILAFKKSLLNWGYSLTTNVIMQMSFS